MTSQPGRAATVSGDSPQHLRVGEEDQVGVLLHDVLRVELRVVVAGLGAVGDVLQPEQARTPDR